MIDAQTIRRHRAEVLATLTDEHPVWVVLNDIIAEARDSSVGASCDPELKSRQRHYQCGYTACAQDIAAELRSLRTEGMLEEDLESDSPDEGTNK
jgi:hypothetical protein